MISRVIKRNRFSEYSIIQNIYYIYYAHNQLIYTYHHPETNQPINITIYIHPVHPRYEYNYQKIKKYFQSLDQHFIWWNNVAGIYKICYDKLYMDYIEKNPRKAYDYLLNSISASTDQKIITDQLRTYLQNRHFYDHLRYNIFKHALNQAFSSFHKNYNFQLEIKIILEYLL